MASPSVDEDTVGAAIEVSMIEVPTIDAVRSSRDNDRFKKITPWVNVFVAWLKYVAVSKNLQLENDV